jgi:thioredoxin 1
MTQDLAPTPLFVACLCARWCNLCEGYRATFETLAARHAQHRFRWIDIEDEADLVHAIDVENFPTLLIASGEQLRFLGVLTPQLETLERVLRAAEEDALPPPTHEVDDDDMQALLSALLTHSA